MSEIIDHEARRIAQLAIKELEEHQKSCLRLWQGLFLGLFIAVVGLILSKVV